MRRQKSCVCVCARMRVRVTMYARMSYQPGIRRRFPARRRPLLCCASVDFGVCVCVCVYVGVCMRIRACMRYH